VNTEALRNDILGEVLYSWRRLY